MVDDKKREHVQFPYNEERRDSRIEDKSGLRSLTKIHPLKLVEGLNKKNLGWAH